MTKSVISDSYGDLKKTKHSKYSVSTETLLNKVHHLKDLRFHFQNLAEIFVA